jgi:ADP-ribosylglycohydrolase
MRAALLILPALASTATKEDRIRGAFWGALVSDALCLGSHYEYDAKVIKKAYGGMINEYMGPGEKLGGTTHGVGWGRMNYHPGQKKGDQTDYGEYTLLMLDYLAENPTPPVDLKKLVPMWEKRLEKWGAWKCTQTKQALQKVKSGASLSSLGGPSNAMSLRSAAALAAFEKEKDVVAAGKTMMFTHANDQAVGGAEFFMRVAWKIIHQDLTPRAAIEASGKEMGKWFQEQVRKGVQKFEEAVDANKPLGKEEFCDDLAMTSMARLWDVGKSEPIRVGKASPTEGTMPSSIYIILKHEQNFTDGVVANAMVGGDNAARSVAVGMVLGAYHGASAVPAHLREGLNAWTPAREEKLSALPLLKKMKPSPAAEL